MLRLISLSKVASFNESDSTFKYLKKTNFIYGNNGTGKSTLSNYFNYMCEEAYINCDHDRSIVDTKLIYNEDFI